MTRDLVADYVSALFWVYSLVIIAWVIANLLITFGVRIPYNRAVRAVLDFLRDVSEPYLRIFRRFLPRFGPLDISPIVALILLQVVNGIVTSLIRG